MNLISKKLKVFAILQLCIVLSYALWCAAWPFMGEIFAVRSKLLLFEVVMGKGDFASRHASSQQMETNQKRFSLLPEQTQKTIHAGSQLLTGKLNRSVFTKVYDAVYLFVFKLPIYLQIWFIGGFFIPLWLLLGKAKAYQAIWLLPLIASFYAIDNRLYAQPAKLPADISLFPTEDYLLSHYLKHPLDSSVLKQREQLANAWDAYLAAEWTGKAVSADNNQELTDLGAYNFLVARVEKLAYHPLESFEDQFKSKASMVMLFLFLMWNFFFALSVFQEKPQELNYSLKSS